MAVRGSIEPVYMRRYLASIFNAGSTGSPTITPLDNSNKFMALFKTLPDKNGANYAEPTGTEYMRIPLNTTGIQGLKLMITSQFDGSGDASGRVVAAVKNQEIIFFPEAYSQAWGTIVGLGVFTTQTTGQGTPIMWGNITDSNGDATTEDILQHEVPLFRINELEVDLY